MKEQESAAQWQRALLPAAFAGFVGGTVILLISALSARITPAPIFQEIARIALGGTVIDPGAATLLGALLHYGVSIGWAIGYALLALRTPALLRAPVLSGVSFGIVVELIMSGILVMVGSFHLPSPAQFLRDFLAHTVGFGLPVALIVAWSLLPQIPPASRAS